MKKLLITSIFLFAVFVAFTQSKPKQTSTEKAPTQKEMQELMKEAQQEIENMSPEDKKMMEEMGIKMPDLNMVGKGVSGISDAQLKKAFLTGTAVQLKKEYEATMDQLREEDNEQTGEGLPNKDFCPRYKETSDKYLRAYNEAIEPLFVEYLEIQKKYLNENTHWQMYSEWPEKFEAHKLEAKIAWLGALTADQPLSFISITEYKCVKPLIGKAGKISQFDDVACKYHSELILPLGKMKIDCSRFTSELDLSVIKFGLKQDLDKETFADQFMSCNEEVGAKAGKEVKAGPLSVEASAGARIGLEIDRTGVKDVYVTGGVKAGAGTNIIGAGSEAAGTPSSMIGVGVSDLSIDGGVEGRISLVSGRGSIYGTGIFGN